MGLDNFKTETGQQYESASNSNNNTDYRDKDWLEEQAETKNRNDRDIAEECEVKPNTIRKWRRKYSIDSGSDYEYDSKKLSSLTSHQIDVIQGSIMGDGSLTSNGSTHTFRLSSGSSEYLEYIANTLPDGMLGDYRYKASTANKDWFDLRTLGHDDFSELRVWWYADGSKSIPDDFEINSTILLHWFIQDGGLSDQYNPRISASWLTEQEMSSISSQLNQSFSLKSKVHNSTETSVTLYVPSDEVCKFYRIIGSCPVEDYVYKWPPDKR